MPETSAILNQSSEDRGAELAAPPSANTSSTPVLQHQSNVDIPSSSRQDSQDSVTSLATQLSRIPSIESAVSSQSPPDSPATRGQLVRQDSVTSIGSLPFRDNSLDSVDGSHQLAPPLPPRRPPHLASMETIPLNSQDSVSLDLNANPHDDPENRNPGGDPRVAEVAPPIGEQHNVPSADESGSAEASGSAEVMGASCSAEPKPELPPRTRHNGKLHNPARTRRAKPEVPPRTSSMERVQPELPLRSSSLERPQTPPRNRTHVGTSSLAMQPTPPPRTTPPSGSVSATHRASPTRRGSGGHSSSSPDSGSHLSRSRSQDAGTPSGSPSHQSSSPSRIANGHLPRHR